MAPGDIAKISDTNMPVVKYANDITMTARMFLLSCGGWVVTLIMGVGWVWRRVILVVWTMRAARRDAYKDMWGWDGGVLVSGRRASKQRLYAIKINIVLFKLVLCLSQEHVSGQSGCQNCRVGSVAKIPRDQSSVARIPRDQRSSGILATDPTRLFW